MSELADLQAKLEETKGLIVAQQARLDEAYKSATSIEAFKGEHKEFQAKVNAAIDANIEKMKSIETALARQPITESVTEQKAAMRTKANAKLRSHIEKMFSPRYHGPECVEVVTPEQASILAAQHPELKGLSIDSDPLGGYLVHPTMSPSIDQKVFELDTMRRISGQVSISTDSFKEPADYGDPECNWVGERQTRSATTSSDLKMLEIPVKEMEQMPTITQNLLDDAQFDLESYLIERASNAFARTEGIGFVSGTGVGQPMGILSYTAGTTYGTIQQVASGTSSDFDGDDLIGLQDTLLEDFQPNARWAMRRATRSFCRQLKDGQGRYLFSVDGGLNGGVQELLLGKPIELLPSMPAIGASSLSVAYGDFRRGYLVVDRMGLRILRDPFSSKPNVLLYMTRRVGGGARAFQAVKILKLAVS